MSETTLDQIRHWRDRAVQGVVTPLTTVQIIRLCDAAERAETLEAEVAKWNKCDSPVCPYEQRALQAEAQLTEVTRERDDAKLALSVVQNAAQTLVRGADRRVLDATKHEPAARVAIATLDSEREMNAILTQQLEAAEGALAPLRAVVEAARNVSSASWDGITARAASARMGKLHDALNALDALPADPSAPAPLVSVTRAQAEQRLTDALVNRIYRAIEHMNGWEDEDNGYDGAKKAIIAALFPDSAPASG